MKNITTWGWAAMAAAALLVLGATACNSSIDDPNDSEAQVTVASYTPTTACVDVDGSIDETAGTTTYTDAAQTLTFESRIRGASEPTAWMDVILTSVDVSYTMATGDTGDVPAPFSTSIGAVTVPAGGTATLPAFRTVPVAYIGPGAPFSTPGRQGTANLVFHGRDAAGTAVSVRGTAALGTYTVCNGN